MYQYDPTTKEVPVNIVGSSVFGRYPKISTEKTINMFQSDTFMVPYAGYQIAINASKLANGKVGRAIFNSTKLNSLFLVIDASLWEVTISYDQATQSVISSTQSLRGTLSSTEGPVYITENNINQILISDNVALYVYNPGAMPPFQIPSINFTPGYISFHDENFLCAASNDFTTGLPTAVNNTWRITKDGASWPNIAQNIGYIQTKPDNTQAVVRFPSKGNMIFVMGEIVTEAWFDTAAKLFPYQRTTQFNIDYGCVSPATVAYMDEIVVWLAQNSLSGPIILYSTGGMPEKITTDGIDYLFSTLQTPSDSEAFLYRQDGHLIYHITFYSDNLSLFYDFNTNKFYNACDQNFNYFIASDLAFYNNQYYFLSKNTGNMYAFDTTIYYYQDTDAATPPNVNIYPIPRIRICKNIRGVKQEYFVLNDIGFTIESGDTNYYQGGPPAVDLSLSYDGGATFGNQWRYELPTIGIRKNRLMWWQCGMSNDIVPQFTFWSIGRVVITDGLAHVRE